MNLFLIFFGVIAVSGGQGPDGDPKHPQTEKVPLEETLHGVKVSDPYRWLEDLDSENTHQWVTMQNKHTFAYLETLAERKPIRERLEKLWNYEKYGLPQAHGSRFFFYKNDGLQNQYVLYWQTDLNAEPKVLLDPNNLSSDGTVALNGTAISPDGKYLAYGLSQSGSDWVEWHVRDVETGKDLSDHIKWVKFSDASWLRDNSGFFYSRYDEPKAGQEMEDANYFQKVFFHKLGTEQAQDVLVYERPDQKEWGFGAQVTEDGNYLILGVWQGTDNRNRVFYKDLKADNAKVVEFLKDFDAEYTFIANQGTVFYFQTNLDAPRRKVIAIDINKPDRANWKTIVAEKKDTLSGVSVCKDRLVLHYMADAKSVVHLVDFEGNSKGELPLPGLGTVGLSTNPESSTIYFSFSSFNTPGSQYSYDVTNGKSALIRQPKLAFNPDDFETKQVFYTSKDGTKVPMFICYKKDLFTGKPQPTYLYGYGGFDISLTPSFSVSKLVWMEMGGIYAMPNLRGGGEYGQEWHLAGTKEKKQNVFDDFIAAGEYLIAQGYTTPQQLAIGGGSNGGLLVGATLNQRPDLFAAALPAVGVMDMLRFHKFTIGWAWVSDYGSPDDPEMFQVLRAYSPYHNVKPGTHYPAVMVLTSDHDDRVVPSHSFKYAAALQEAQAGDAPILIRIETKAGHGAGKPTSKVIEEEADRWAFLFKNLGMQKLPFS
ncbi:MAG: S9 family peptidase [Acidobacteria bacterium]|nr:S9 family peptidase [Acidobacteriota bacterium]MCB9397265.1 S9 family peptidase [Acidobacteriota bacterium]